MAIKTERQMPTDAYFELVREFPLTHIQDDEHLEAASAMLNDLMRKDLDEGGQEYLEVLSDLIEKYEDENVEFDDASEADVLRILMTSNNLTQTSLAKAVGISQSTISAVLNGERKLTKGHVVKLAKFFSISPAAFLPS